jgi:predicted phosphodiesterase
VSAPTKKEWKRFAFISDIHAPHHSESCLALVKAWLKIEKPDIVVLGGDILDCGTISKFRNPRGPRYPDFKAELDACKEAVHTLVDACGKAKIIWGEGNHELRLPSYVMACSPQLHRLISIPDLMQPLPGVKWIEAKRGSSFIYELTDKLLVAHGERYSSVSSANVARLTLHETKRSIIVGHNHAEGTHRESGGHYGKEMVALVAGCLCEAPTYRMNHRWTHGFVAGVINEHTGEFEIDHMRISDHESRLYTGKGTLVAINHHTKGYQVKPEYS